MPAFGNVVSPLVAITRRSMGKKKKLLLPKKRNSRDCAKKSNRELADETPKWKDVEDGKRRNQKKKMSRALLPLLLLHLLKVTVAQKVDNETPTKEVSLIS